MTSPEQDRQAVGPVGPRRSRRFWTIILLVLLASVGTFWWTNPELFSIGAPERDRPEVLFHLREPERLLDTPVNPNAPAEFERFRQKQPVFLKARYLTERALASEAMKGIVIPGVQDPNNLAAWIVDRLQVELDGPQILRLTVRDIPRPESVQLLNAIAGAYVDEVVRSERRRELDQYNELDKAYKELITDIRRRRHELKMLRDRVGAEGSVEVELLQSEIDGLEEFGRDVAGVLYKKRFELRPHEFDHSNFARIQLLSVAH